MAFYQLPNPYDPHYAIPDYVMAEPPGRGTFTTKWLPRGTIFNLTPDAFAKPILGEKKPVPTGLGYIGEGWIENAIPKVSAVANGIHAYQRTKSVGWAAAWALLGYLQPVLTTGVAAAAAFGDFDIEGSLTGAYHKRRGKRSEAAKRSDAEEMGYATNPPRRRRRRRARRRR